MDTTKGFKLQNSKASANKSGDSASQTAPLQKQESQKRVRELEILQGELKSMKKGGQVYKQQPNSHIFFKQGMEQTLSEAKREIDELIQEYKDAEKCEEAHVKGEEDDRDDG